MVDLRGYIPKRLRPLSQRHLKQETWPDRLEISELVRSIVSDLRSVHIIVNAVDECSDINGTGSELLKELRQLLHHIRFLCTSRYITDNQLQFEDYPHLEIRATEGDINAYLEDHIENESRLKRHIHGDSSLLRMILNVIMQNFNGL